MRGSSTAEKKGMVMRAMFRSDIRRLVPPVAFVAALLIAGCSKEKQPEPSAASQETGKPATTTAPAVPESPTVGGDGSAITLNSLSSADIRGAKLPGELGCGFSDASGSALLIAMGDAASTGPATGIVKVADSVEQIAAPGGFDAMVKGVTFTGAGKTVRIELTGSPIGNTEAPPIPARLVYERADGAQRSFAGRWECGP